MLILGVSLTHLVESRDLFFLEAEIVDNIFQWNVLRNYPGSEVPQRKPSKQGEEREPLVTCGEAFQMIGPIKLSHSISGIWFDWQI